jgi:multidrug efflux system outer membrane protein
MRRLSLLAAAALSVTACATASAPTQPAPGAPEAWTFLGPQAAAAQNPWWRQIFADPALAALAEEAGQTPSVEAARARREAAEARLQAAFSALFPSVSVGLEVSGRADDADETNASSASATVGYSRNLAGAERLREAAAAARLEAADASLAAARLDARVTAARLIATALSAETQEAAARRSLAAAQESLNLAETRSRAGLDNALAVAQARTARDRAAALLPPLTQARLQARLGLEALLARPLGAQSLSAAEPFALAQPPFVEAPATVLARRPDLRLALAALAVADREAAAAEADRWPTLSIAAVFSVTQSDIPPHGAAATLTGSLLQPIFDAGRREALSEAAQAEAEAAEADYRRAVANAVGDVETSLVRLRETRAARDGQAAVVASGQEQSDLARSRYASGLTSFLNVTIADAALAEAELGLAQADGAVLEAQILLANSLGLGADF